MVIFTWLKIIVMSIGVVFLPIIFSKIDKGVLLMLTFTTYLFYFFIGTIIGSYSNMLIYRYVYGESIWTKQRSFCPSCKETLKWYHLIPLLSYLALKGKCGFCKKDIHSRYFNLELYSGLLFVFIMHNVTFTVDNLIFYFILLIFLVPIFYIDVMIHLIYDGYMKFLILLTAVVLYINEYIYHFNLDVALPSFKNGLIGFVIIYFSIIIFNKIGGFLFYGDYRADLIGMGDVRLIAWVYMILGSFSEILIFIFLSACFSACMYVFHQIAFHKLYVKKEDRKQIKFEIVDNNSKGHKFSVNLNKIINPLLFNRFQDESKLSYAFFVESVDMDNHLITLRSGKTCLSLKIDENTGKKIEKDKKNAGFDFYINLDLNFDESYNVISYDYTGISDYELYLQSMMRNKVLGSEGVPFAPGLIFGFVFYILFSDTIFPMIRDIFITVN